MGLPTMRERLRKAWEARHAALVTDEVAAARAAALHAHLVELYPQDEMAVLAKYRCADTCSQVTVYVRCGNEPVREYSTPLQVEVLPLLLPAGAAALYCFPRYAQDPTLGLTDKYRAELEADGKLAAFIAEQEEREARYIPEAWEAHFRELVTLIRAGQADWKRVDTWVDDFRKERGRFPRWSEFPAAFPVLTSAHGGDDCRGGG